jgi:hypothetical protein
MFKKIAIVAGLLSALSAQADIRVLAQLDVTQNAQTKQIHFDTEIVERDYYGITILHDAIGRLGIRVIDISDELVTVEFFIEDAEGNLISKPTCKCAWDKPVSVTIGVKKEGEVIEQVALTVTLSRI